MWKVDIYEVKGKEADSSAGNLSLKKVGTSSSHGGGEGSESEKGRALSYREGRRIANLRKIRLSLVQRSGSKERVNVQRTKKERRCDQQKRGKELALAKDGSGRIAGKGEARKERQTGTAANGGPRKSVLQKKTPYVPRRTKNPENHGGEGSMSPREGSRTGTPATKKKIYIADRSQEKGGGQL